MNPVSSYSQSYYQNLQLSSHEGILSPQQTISIFRPELVVTVFGGYSLPEAQFKGNLTSLSVPNPVSVASSYYEKWGFNFGAGAKLPIDKKGAFKVDISLTFSSFLQNGTDSSGNYTVKPRFLNTQVGLGAEWAYVQSKTLIPFVGFDFTANILDGYIEFTNATDDYTANYNLETRYGMSFGAGANYKLDDAFSILVGAKYNIANLFAKKYGTSGAHDLNDASFTIGSSTIAAKSISFLNFYAGLSLTFGDTKRITVKK